MEKAYFWVENRLFWSLLFNILYLYLLNLSLKFIDNMCCIFSIYHSFISKLCVNGLSLSKVSWVMVFMYFSSNFLPTLM